jgi:hypothetical protein
MCLLVFSFVLPLGLIKKSSLTTCSGGIYSANQASVWDSECVISAWQLAHTTSHLAISAKIRGKPQSISYAVLAFVFKEVLSLVEGFR